MHRRRRRSVALVVMVAMVLALAVGTAVAKDKPALGKGDAKVPEQVAPGTKGQATDEGRAKGPQKQLTCIFKGTITQDGAEGSPLEVKVAKANKAAHSFVGKQLGFAVSSDTEIYLDEADVQRPELEAKLPELKAGDKVVVRAEAPQGASGFSVGMISTERPPAAGGRRLRRLSNPEKRQYRSSVTGAKSRSRGPVNHVWRLWGARG